MFGGGVGKANGVRVDEDDAAGGVWEGGFLSSFIISEGRRGKGEGETDLDILSLAVFPRVEHHAPSAPYDEMGDEGGDRLWVVWWEMLDG